MKWGVLVKLQLNKQQLEYYSMDQLCRVLRQIPFVSDIETHMTGLPFGFGDFGLTIHFINDIDPLKMYVEVKTRGEKRFASSFILMANQHLDERACYVFMAPYISEQTAGMLKQHHFSYMDLSGNCHIVAGAIYISVEGKPNQFKDHEYNRNYFSKRSSAASAILREMMVTPYEVMHVKTIAEKAKKSIGAVSNVKTYLLEHGWAEEYEKGFRLSNTDEMLKAWGEEYKKIPNQTVLLYSLDDIPVLEKEIQNWNHTHGGHAVLGFFSAAARYAPVVRYKKIYVYVDRTDLEEFILDLQLERVSTGENVSVILPHDNTPCLHSKFEKDALITSPVQTVLDLLSGIGRGEEAAEAIIQKEYMSNA